MRDSGSMDMSTIPEIMPIADPSRILEYFKNFVITYSNSTGFFDIIIIVDFFISILMLVSAFYMLTLNNIP